jgi:Trk K+ transport system NAD-binding subunit
VLPDGQPASRQEMALVSCLIACKTLTPEYIVRVYDADKMYVVLKQNVGEYFAMIITTAIMMTNTYDNWKMYTEGFDNEHWT